MSNLKKIRDEWNLRPIEGAAPDEIEKRFPKREELYADEKQCQADGCTSSSFRGQPRCRTHHLEWIAQIEAENQKTESETEKYLKTKKGAEEAAMGTAKAVNIHCSECGRYLRYSERIVVAKGKIPKRPDFPHQVFKVICSDCK